MGKSIGKLLGGLLPAVAGSLIFPGLGLSAGLGGAVGSGLGTLAQGGSPLNALASGLGSYAGGQLFGSAGNIGPGGTVAKGLGGIGLDSVANALPAELAGSDLGSAVGSFAGGNVASSMVQGAPGTQVKSAGPVSPTAGAWTKATTAPGSLSGFSGLDPTQTSTNIANKGVYGGGNGQQESDYFLNLINSRLTDTDSSNDNLQPIEQSYLSQLGLGGTNNNQDLLKKLSAYQG